MTAEEYDAKYETVISGFSLADIYPQLKKVLLADKEAVILAPLGKGRLVAGLAVDLLQEVLQRVIEFELIAEVNGEECWRLELTSTKFVE